MVISRLIAVSFVASVCVLPAAAQSPIANETATSEFEFKPSDAPDRIRLDQFRLPPTSFLQSDSRPQLGSFEGDPVKASTEPAHRNIAKNHANEDSASICYSMRSYRVTREDPHSDTTELAGYSTCQPATRFQVKSAEDAAKLLRR